MCLVAPSSIASDSINHSIEYGIVDFDSAYMVRNQLSEWPSIINYTYYFSDISQQSSPYEITPEYSRINWVKTNVMFNLLEIYNLSGNYYFNDSYDIEYSVFYQNRSEENGIQSSFIINKTINETITLGAGLYVRAGEQFNGHDFENEFELENTVTLLQAKYSNVNNNRGWHTKIQFNFAQEGAYKNIRASAERFHSKNSSTKFGFGYQYEEETFRTESYTTYSIAQKFWISPSVALDIGISQTFVKDEYPYSGQNTNKENNTLFDFNGTYMF